MLAVNRRIDEFAFLADLDIVSSFFVLSTIKIPFGREVRAKSHATLIFTLFVNRAGRAINHGLFKFILLFSKVFLGVDLDGDLNWLVHHLLVSFDMINVNVAGLNEVHLLGGSHIENLFYGCLLLKVLVELNLIDIWVTKLHKTGLSIS